jgi:hypothetical protein
VLGAPDGQVKKEEAYDELTGAAVPMRLAGPLERGVAWLLALKGDWFRCTVDGMGEGPLWIMASEQPIAGGMSGSPVISPAGEAIGICCVGGEDGDHEGGPNPTLLNIYLDGCSAGLREDAAELETNDPRPVPRRAGSAYPSAARARQARRGACGSDH